MSDERLQQLLRQADEAFGSALPGPAGLGVRVRARARRQHRVRMIGGAAASVLVLAVVSTAWVGQAARKGPTPGSRASNPSPPAVSVAEVQARIAQLSEEVRTGCDALEEALRREDMERKLAALRKQAEADPLEEVKEQVDRAALTMVYQADRMYRELNLRDSAIASYEQTIKLFPETHWAEVAKERLTEIQASNKGDAS